MWARELGGQAYSSARVAIILALIIFRRNLLTRVIILFAGEYYFTRLPECSSIVLC
jgi:hypothetical protein